MIPIDGENQKKRVVSFLHIHVAIKLQFWLIEVAFSATFSILISVDSIMDLGIRMFLFTFQMVLDVSNWLVFSPLRMKPTRIRMCHSLVMNYGLYKKMEIFVRCCKVSSGVL